MKLKKFHLFGLLAFSFAAGSLVTLRAIKIEEAHAQSNRFFELRTYHTLPGKLPDLVTRFRDHTTTLFVRHGMTNIGHWLPADAPASQNTYIYIMAYPSREARNKSWAEFTADPEWQAVSKASEANGKIVEKVDSVFMDPTDFSPIK
jgi:NIPSNAP